MSHKRKSSTEITFDSPKRVKSDTSSEVYVVIVTRFTKLTAERFTQVQVFANIIGAEAFVCDTKRRIVKECTELPEAMKQDLEGLSTYDKYEMINQTFNHRLGYFHTIELFARDPVLAYDEEYSSESESDATSDSDEPGDEDDEDDEQEEEDDDTEE
jgi:hypothetical protein